MEVTIPLELIKATKQDDGTYKLMITEEELNAIETGLMRIEKARAASRPASTGRKTKLKPVYKIIREILPPISPPSRPILVLPKTIGSTIKPVVPVSLRSID